MTPEEQKNFSLIARFKSTTHAFRGILLVLKTQHNAWLQVVIGVILIILGVVFSISSIEWCLLVISIGLTIALEAMNTAIEIDMDLTSPTYHPFARDTKDAAAGGVLVAAIILILVSCIIFIPKIIPLFFK